MLAKVVTKLVKKNASPQLLCKLIVSCSIAIFFLWLALCGVQTEEIIYLINMAKINLLILACGIYALSMVCRMWRWHWLVNNFAKVCFKDSSLILIIGYAANNILPARLGELFRADFCKRKVQLSRIASLGAIVLERVQDGIYICIMLGIGIFNLSLQTTKYQILINLMVASLVIFSGLVIGIFIITHNKIKNYIAKYTFINKFYSPLISAIAQVRTKQILPSLSITLLIWVLDSCCILSLLSAVEVHISLMQAGFLVAVIALSTLLPAAPGFIGTMQYAAVLVLTAYGYTAAVGIIAALSFQVCIILPITMLGIILYGLLSKHTSDINLVKSIHA